MILAIYDISGIQPFIFATTKLKETAGASFIVRDSLFKTVPEIFKVPEDQWKNAPFSWNDADKQKIVYIGGGNALLAFDSPETQKKFTYDLSKRAFEASGGKFKLAHACIEADPNRQEALSDVLKDLYEKLDAYKRNSPNALAAGGFSINALHNETREPLLLDEETMTYSAKSVQVKREAERREKGEIITPPEDVKFTREFETYRKNEEGEKNYLAVIHIDGNTMGKNIKAFTQKQTAELSANLDKMRVLSIKISDLYQNALKSATTELVKSEIAKDFLFPKGDYSVSIPFRPVIADGDDVTVICAAEIAFEFVEIFMRLLAEDTSLSEYGFGVPTAAAGIAFVNIGFPYHVAYEQAEKLCKDAKAKLVKKGFTGGKTKSAIDFRIFFGGVNAEMSEKLFKRPYIFGIDGEDGYDDFKQKRADILNFPKSKLKGLRNAYGKGENAAKVYSEMLKARHPGDKIAEKLSDAYHGDNAAWFDVLDVMDFDTRRKDDD